MNCCSAVSDLGRASSIGLDTETEVFRLAGEELQCKECGKSELLGGDSSLEESDSLNIVSRVGEESES